MPDKPTQEKAPETPTNPFKDLIGQADAETRANLVRAVVEHLGTDPDAQRQFRESIQVAPMTVQRARNAKQKTQNKDVQNFSRAYGDVVRTDPNFLPVPPEHIKEKGEWAVRKYHEDWLAEKNEHNAFEYEEDMSEQVHM